MIEKHINDPDPVANILFIADKINEIIDAVNAQDPETKTNETKKEVECSISAVG